MVLLDMVHRWVQANDGPTLYGLHIHHGLSEHADRWALLCEQQCIARKIAFQCHRVSVAQSDGSGLEAAARAARYAAFEHCLEEGDVLLQGHHQDDQIETIIYRLLRGAGPRGLTGIPETRALARGTLCRPLLNTNREQINAWAQHYDLPFEEDPSNRDVTLDRNYIRHELLPVIAARWPGYRQTISRVGRLQALTMTGLEQAPLARVVGFWDEPGLSLGPLSTGALPSEDDAMSLAHQLYRWLLEDGFDPPPAKRLTEFARQCRSARADRQPQLKVNNQRLIAWQGSVYRIPYAERTVALPDSVTVGESIIGPWGALRWEPDLNGLPEGLAVGLTIRNAGEKMTLAAGGPSRTFKNICQAYKVPPWWRSALPVLTHEGQAVFLVGVAKLKGASDLPKKDKTAGFSPHWRPLLE